VSLLNAAALATALSVGLTMLAALTILPVLLSRFGERIGSHKRSRRAAGAQAPDNAGFWPRWARLVTRHPWPALIAGLSIMLLLAAQRSRCVWVRVTLATTPPASRVAGPMTWSLGGLARDPSVRFKSSHNCGSLAIELRCHT